jgi:uncharacterized protein (TIGR03000 family)
MPQPGTPPAKPDGTPAVGGKEEASLVAPATIVVSLPADARLMIDDNPTSSTSAIRTFATPALQTGKEFSYTLKGQIVRDGRTITATKEVAVRGGAETRVTLDFPEASVAQK